MREGASSGRPQHRMVQMGTQTNRSGHADGRMDKRAGRLGATPRRGTWLLVVRPWVFSTQVVPLKFAHHNAFAPVTAVPGDAFAIGVFVALVEALAQCLLAIAPLPGTLAAASIPDICPNRAPQFLRVRAAAPTHNGPSLTCRAATHSKCQNQTLAPRTNPQEPVKARREQRAVSEKER